MSVRSLNTFFQSEPAIKPLLRRISELSHVQRLYNQTVAPSLRKLGEVGSFRDGTLIIFAVNGAAAAKLKQVLPEITEKISQQLQQVIQVRVSVQVDFSAQNPASPRQSKPPMGPQALGSLRKLAAELPPSPLKDEVALLLARQTATKR
jgi:hypothetical protein